MNYELLTVIAGLTRNPRINLGRIPRQAQDDRYKP
jgi:hypothetical protein